MASISSRVRTAHELEASGLHDEAIKVAAEILDEEPNNALALYVATRCFNDLDRPGFGQVFGERLTRLVPKESAAWVNYGNAYQIGFDIPNAINCNAKALELDPENFAALSNLVLAHSSHAEPEKAMKYLLEAERLSPHDRNIKENKGILQLMIGEWEGWKHYNRGVGTNSDRKRRSYLDYVEPVWKGQKGKNVVLYGEQGLGDEICFASVVPEMMKDCNLIIETQAKLEGLFRNSFDVPVYGTRYTHGLEWPDHHRIDAVISMSQAMELYRQKDEDFTGKPYLVADEQKRKVWRAILGCYPGKKIGVAWSAGTTKTGKKVRSVPLECFKGMGTLVSLEYKDPSEEIKESGIEMLDFHKFLDHKDYGETAALVSELDHVICATTAIADLCGALGKSCDVLVPERPHWRYYGDSDKSIWYDSHNLIRQNGTWQQTIGDAYPQGICRL